MKINEDAILFIIFSVCIIILNVLGSIRDEEIEKIEMELKITKSELRFLDEKIKSLKDKLK